VSGAVSLSIAGVAWKRRLSAGATALAVTMMAMAIWAWMYAIFWLVPSRSEKLFWLSLAFIGVVITSPAFLVMAAQFSGKTSWPTRRIFVLLAILPTLILFSVWTEPWFGLFFGGVDFLKPENALRGGPGFLLSVLNAYGTTFVAVIYLLQALRSAYGSRRKQITFILVGISFQFLAGQISAFKLSPFPGLDLTPIVFSLSGLCYAYALFSQKVIDLVHMGRDSILEEMEDGVLVLDYLDRIIYLNQKALAFVNAEPRNPIGRPIAEVLPTWLIKVDLNHKSKNSHYRLEAESHDFKHYDISITPLLNKAGEAVGRTFVVRDISIQKGTEAKLRRLNAQIEEQSIEISILHTQLREQAIRDSLTGLFNRGYLEETLERELVRAGRGNISLCVMMIDIDSFKHVNDTYGHSAGDMILRVFGKLLLQKIRGDDVACRYGGDEFVVLMPNISIKSAIQRGEQISQLFSELEFQFEDALFQTTISIGIASFPAHEKSGDKLLMAADKALCSTKGERNRISKYVST